MSIKAVKLVVDKNITRDQLIASIDKYLKLVGCTACGLLGHGLYIQGDPEPFRTLVRGELIKDRSILEVASFKENIVDNFAEIGNR